MICDVDHVLIHLRNKQTKNKHQVRSLVHWDVQMFTFHPSFKSLMWLMVLGFIMCYSANYLIVHSHIYMCAFYKMLQYNIWQINCGKWPETVSFIKFSGINPNNCLLYLASCVGGWKWRAQCATQAGLFNNDMCLGFFFALLIKTLMVTSLAFLLLWLCVIWCDTVNLTLWSHGLLGYIAFRKGKHVQITQLYPDYCLFCFVFF